MKYIFALALLFSCFVLVAQPPTAESVLEQAQREALQSNKNVFVMFHASWCSWCRRMEKLMAEPDMKPLFDKNYVMAYLTVMETPDKKDLENPGADKVLAQYKGDKGGIPFWYITDGNGKFIEDSREIVDGKKAGNVGSPASENEVDYFIYVLKKSSSLNDSELASIKEKFLMKN